MLITIHSAPPLKNLRSFWKGTIRSHVIVWRRHSKQPRRARILASGALAAANQPYWFCTCIILPSLSRDWCAIVHRKSSFCVFLSHNICRRGLVTRCSSVFTDGISLHRFPKEEKQDNFGFQVNNTAGQHYSAETGSTVTCSLCDNVLMSLYVKITRVYSEFILKKTHDWK